MRSMMSGSIHLYDYLIHEGQVDGETVCALLWTARDWPFTSNARVSPSPSEGGFQDLLIASDEGSLLLRSIDKRLLKMICEKGLLIIYQDVKGSRHVHIPPSQGAA